MWKRLCNIFRAMFGWMLRSAEDPELILNQYMDDMRNKIPQMNAQVRDIVAIEKQAEIQTERLRQQVAALQPKCEAAVKLGPSAKDAALSLLNSLQTAKADLAAAEEQLVRLKVQSATVMANRKAYEQQINQKINDAKQQIGRAKRAAIEQQMAELTMSFQQNDDSATLDRMTEKIDEKQAKAQAASEVAGSTVASQLLEVEKASGQAEAEGMYAEMQKQLGLVVDTGPAPERTMNAVSLETTTEVAPEAPKTIEGTN